MWGGDVHTSTSTFCELEIELELELELELCRSFKGLTPSLAALGARRTLSRDCRMRIRAFPPLKATQNTDPRRSHGLFPPEV